MNQDDLSAKPSDEGMGVSSSGAASGVSKPRWVWLLRIVLLLGGAHSIIVGSSFFLMGLWDDSSSWDSRVLMVSTVATTFSFSLLAFLIRRSLRRGEASNLGGWLVTMPILVPILVLFLPRYKSTMLEPVMGTFGPTALAGLVAFVLLGPRTKKHIVAACLFSIFMVAYGVGARWPSIQFKRLLTAVNDGDLSRVEELVVAGASLDTLDDRGRTPLMIAAEGGNLAVVQAVLAGNGSVGMQDESGSSALSIAVEDRNFDLIRLLVAAGAPIYMHDWSSEPGVLAIAIDEGDKETAVLLLEEVRRRILIEAGERDG